MINTIKNFIMIVLSILAIYLTGQLWFEEISNRNFFYTLSDYLNLNSQTTTNNNIGIKPYRIVTNFSDNEFHLIYNDIHNSLEKKLSDEIIKKTLDKGIFIETSDFLQSNINKYPYYSYEFPFSINVDFFIRSFGTARSLISSNVKIFNYIILILDEDNHNTIRTLFVDTYNNSYTEYQIIDLELADNFINSFTQIQNNQTKILFNSINPNEKNSLITNIYKPNPLNNMSLFSSITFENNYSYNGEVVFQSAGKNLELFLNAATLTQPRRLNGAYTFSDKNSIVRYYPTNVIEYSNYVAQLRKTQKNILNDYYSAIKFIESDHIVTNEYYLANYYEDGETTVFCFDYAINNLPLILSDELKDTIDLNHMIEVTVQNEHVIKYKKLAYTFLIDSDDLKNDDIKFTNELLQSKNIQDAVLSYKLKSLDNIELDWNIKF